MFDLLKKKIGGFIDNLVNKGEKKEEKLPEKPREEKIEVVEEPVKHEIKKEETIRPVKEKKVESTEPKTKVEKKEKKTPPAETKEKPQVKHEKKIDPKKELPKEELILPKIAKTETEKHVSEILPETKKQEQPKKIELKEEPREQKVKLGIFKQVTSILTGEVEISEKEVEELLENLELELLESDVAIEVAEEIKVDLKNAIVGSKIKRGELNSFVKNTIKNTLTRIVKSEKGFDILERLGPSERPMKILILGVNGAGKTTTIAKIAKMLLNNKSSVVLASADTFRAAAIEQMQVHADRLGVRNIKRDYGSDPTAVAYDAVNYAKAHDIDVVLIDTAGRQETDTNLINELKKINRVIQPHIKIYIGESIAGNGILSQVEEFNEAIGIDGVILTKIDCDAKGGTVLSITKATGIPIIYLGTGQQYEDLEKFDAEKTIDRILE